MVLRARANVNAAAEENDEGGFIVNEAAEKAGGCRFGAMFGKAKKGAKVFVVTYATAAGGITLTAASRVYLMEPALDPAVEMQAAGRIHR